MIRTAHISACGAFRYTLTRDWSNADIDSKAERRALLFVMLNPSTADAYQNDPTISKCVRYAVSHGFNAISVVNLFAFRTTEPRELRDAGWQVGPENDAVIRVAAMRAQGICLAWGTFAARTPRAGEVLQLLRRAAPETPLMCLDTSKDGHPKHPLYLSGALRLKPFEVRHA